MALSTILAGYDLSLPGDAALERAITLAVQHRAKLLIVNAQDARPGHEHADNALVEKLGEVSEAVREAETTRLTERLAGIEKLGVVAELCSRGGPPGEVLATFAHERDADLIVVGTHGHTALKRFLLGSVAAETLRSAPCDVLVCRGDGKLPFARPLVAMDFSAPATRAIGHAVELVGPDVPIDLVHAWQLPAGSWGATLLGQARFPWSTVRDAVLASAQSQADRVIAEQAALGRKVAIEMIQGAPADVITEAADKHPHDVVVVGTHGHRGFRKLLLGSVAEDVIRHAPCSVLVVHGEHAGETARFEKAY